MRNLLITTVLALVALFPAAAMDNEGHVLTDLWNQFQQARKADRPQKEAEILAEIRKQAQKQHLPVDFYDAATEYVNTVQRRDWKQADALREELEDQVKRFGHPLVTFLWMREWSHASTDQLWAYVKDHQKGFQGHNPALYRGVDVFLNGTFRPFIRSDREFALWNLLQGRRYADTVQDEICQELKQELAGAYPGEGTLEYYILSRKSFTQAQMPEKKAAFQALRDRYQGQAVGLYPAADLLLMEKEELDSRKAGGSQYRDLREQCYRFETLRKSFRGDEAALAGGCTGVRFLIEELESQDLAVQIDSARILVLFKNLYHANLTLRQGKSTVKTWRVANLTESFYVNDTVSIDLPQLPDGSYTIEARNGKRSTQEHYSQYTLSMAVRQEGEGRSVYVTDYRTGEPLPFVTLRLLKGEEEVATTNLRLRGFTPLPASFEKQISGRTYYTLEAVYGDRRSPALGVGRESGIYPESGSYCNVYLDRGAYQPGDTLQLKAILFEGSYARGMKVSPGRKVALTLTDSEGNSLQTRELSTNDWGSVSCSFIIPTGLRGGLFRIDADGKAVRWFRVDEFVLPSFEVTFDPVQQLYLPGSQVPVTGRVKSYSGHNLSGATAGIRVTRYGAVVLEKEQELGADNRFAFTFPAREGGFYEAEVRITDATGETLEFHNAYYIDARLRLETRVLDPLEGKLVLKEDSVRDRTGDVCVIGSRQLSVLMRALDADGNQVPVPLAYKLLLSDGTLLREGTLSSGETLKTELPRSGVYRLKTTVSVQKEDGETVSTTREDRILCTLPGEGTVAPEVKRLFLPGRQSIAPSQGIEARLGTSAGMVYAVATLFGEERRALESRLLVVENGSLAALNFAYPDSYPDAVRLMVFFFKDGEATRFEQEYRRARDKFTLPLGFTRFQDKAYPGTEYTFSIKTGPAAEVLAAAWDKSLDAIAPNGWPMVNTRDYSVDEVPLGSVCGRVEGSVRYGDVRFRALTMSKAANAVAGEVLMDSAVAAYAEEAAAEPAPDAAVKARVDFSTSLTFQPQLYPRADGTLDLRFRTSDKLSTFYVRVYAHDKDLRNALCEGEMVVSLPVKVSLQEPRFLYAGDLYQAAVSVSSVADEPVSGVVVLRAGDSVQQLPVTLAPGETQVRAFAVNAKTPGDLTLKASFVGGDFSDAVQVSVPVYPAAQQLTETHSAVLLDAMSRDALLEALRSRFVNVPASKATLKEITVMDMVKDAIPSHVEPRGSDVLSLSEAWYVRVMSGIPTGDLMDQILSCRNADGGFGWFEGMSSNPIITAVVLERFALLKESNDDIPDLSGAVRYLDATQFGTSFPVWRGWLSDAQYMRVRALYPGVPFQVKPVSAADKKRLNQFRKDAKAYLTPSGKEGRGLQGQILAKARRLLTLRSLNASAEGRQLAHEWGVKLSSKLEASIRADVVSLLEYAVEHRDGGWYYPNAVMPFRGLLESEAYAHALLCQLLKEDDPRVADGIRLWLMLQKETQKWDTDPAFVDAIAAILDGSQEVLNTRVLVLSASFQAAFQDIRPAGNGFTVERKFFRDKEEIHPGEALTVGDKIRIEYRIWNAENRSFVKLTAGREASLRPVDQLSGYRGWYTPRGYRHVKADATEYFFDSYPEENTVIAEEFFVTQAGRFVAPVTVIESLYAPHYRANSGFIPARESGGKEQAPGN